MTKSFSDMFHLSVFQHMNVLLILVMASLINGYTLSDVQRLKKELLTDSGYDRNLRPILNQSRPMEVNIYILSR